MRSLTVILLLPLFVIVLLSSHADAGARHRPSGTFEVTVNEEMTYPLRFVHRSLTVHSLSTDTVDVYQARIQNIEANRKSYKEAFEVSSIKCILMSAADRNFLSPIFSEEKPLAEPFPDTDRIYCVPYINIENKEQEEEALVFLEDSTELSDVHGLKVEPRYKPIIAGKKDRRYTKLAVLFAPHRQTVCQFNVRGEESIFLREGESWGNDSGVDIALINCHNDWRGQISTQG